MNRRISFFSNRPSIFGWAKPSMMLMFVVLSGLPCFAMAQRGSLPSQDYYQTFFDYYGADYQDAGKSFTRGAATAFKFGDDRFLDSLCYWTMMGECYYHSGNYAQAIEMYETALNLYLSYSSANWQARVQLPAIQTATTSVQRAGINWGVPSRTAQFTNLPSTMLVTFGNFDAGRAFVEGGIVNPAEQRRVDVQEIMRCTALAMHRRRVIKGPTCQYDPFTTRLLAGIGRGGAGNGTLFGSWNGVLSGIAKASAGDTKGAVILLQRSLQVQGGLDHWLTPVALIEMAHLAVEEGNGVAAEKLALEASYCAAVFNQYDLVEEGLSLATTVHLTANRTPYPPLEAAIVWAGSNKARLLQASMTVRLAECFAEAGDAQAAGQVLGQLGRATSRTSLPRCVVGSRALYVEALIDFLRGNFDRGSENLVDALAQFQNGSLWLYRLALADQLVIDGSITPRQGNALYQLLLHDPTSEEWRLDPMEAMAFLKFPHVGAMERWFEIKVTERNAEQAINVADLVRRHRFFSTLPLGGRLLAFRWVLESPVEALSKEGLKQRLDFVTRFPEYKQLADRAEEIRIELIKLPVKPDDGSDELKQQTDLFVELAKVSQFQESMLASFALRREPAELAFPPSLDLSSYRDKIREDQMALVTLATPVGYHMYLVGHEGERYLGMGRARDVNAGMGKLFKSLGIKDVSGGLDLETLQDESWKEIAFELGQSLFAEATEEDWNKYKELVIIPDGVLWYLPFEILPVGSDLATSAPLGEKISIRYCPTLALAFGEQRPVRQLNRTAIVAGRMHPKADPVQTSEVVTQLQIDLPLAASFDDKIRIPTNLLGSTLDELVVLSDLKLPSRGGPYGLSPAQLDQGRNGSTLASWLSLPWRGPEHMVLPGFTSGGAAGVRSNANGSEMFATTCAMMASGVRTILISRWRVGGRNSLELAREYARNLKTMPATEALRESVDKAKLLELDPANEPRMKTKKLDQPLLAEHPFFWAGHMLVEVPNANSSGPPAVPAKPAAVDPNAVDPDAPKDAADKPDPAKNDGKDMLDPDKADEMKKKEDDPDKQKSGSEDGAKKKEGEEKQGPGKSDGENKEEKSGTGKKGGDKEESGTGSGGPG